jgi:hypothetical protein
MAICSAAISITQGVSCARMEPDSSASAMKRGTSTAPSSGCVQRASASKPSSVRGSMRKMGW